MSVRSEPVEVALDHEGGVDGRGGAFVVTVKNVGNEVLYNWTQELVAPRSLVVAVSNLTFGAYQEKSSDEGASRFHNTLGYAKVNPIRPGARSRPLKVPYQVADYNSIPWDEKVVACAYAHEKVDDQIERLVRELLPTRPGTAPPSLGTVPPMNLAAEHMMQLVGQEYEKSRFPSIDTWTIDGLLHEQKLKFELQAVGLPSVLTVPVSSRRRARTGSCGIGSRSLSRASPLQRRAVNPPARKLHRLPGK